jgi:uncharacterized protein
MVSWAISFIFVDGKMRGLFSFLFGAGMLLVIEQAQTRGEASETVHFRRMFWLLAFGLVHLYLIWFGDILVGYALVGMIAFLFREVSRRALIGWAIGLLLIQLLLLGGLAGMAAMLQEAAAAPGADPAAIARWQGLEAQFGAMGAQAMAEDFTHYRGGYGVILAARISDEVLTPVDDLAAFGCETLAYFLLGMAALKSGFLSGAWSRSAYRRTALLGFGIGIPAYAGLAWLLVRDGFSVTGILAWSMAATVPLRPIMVAATVALVILATRKGGALTDRIAAAGRVAFTNYLGTSLIMTTLFYGYGGGLYGTLGRAQLWLVVFAMWAVMLLWSKRWLDRFRYGPFEWLWRSLARGAIQPIRRRSTPSSDTG